MAIQQPFTIRIENTTAVRLSLLAHGKVRTYEDIINDLLATREAHASCPKRREP